MNSIPQTSAPRRRFWRWVMLGIGLCLAPFVVLALVAASYLTLDRDATALRKQVMAATTAGWKTKIQLSVGGLTLGAVRSGLGFAHGEDIAEARQALAAVRRASVGVYECKTAGAVWSRAGLFATTDQAMAKRGWTRLVGVADHKDTVLVYVNEDIAPGRPVDVCVAVVSGRELVVVSTSVDAAKLAELAASHAPDEVKRHLRLARLRF